MQTHIHIFESSKLEGSYVGDLLCLEQRDEEIKCTQERLRHMEDTIRRVKYV